jgi:hypothetical protein
LMASILIWTRKTWKIGTQSFRMIDPWLTVGETEFTHATQDRDHGAPESQRRTVGASQYDPTYSSSSYSDTSQSRSFYPIPDINAQPQTTWVYEWKDPKFYNMLVGEWQTTSAWTGLTWQQYKGELLRMRGLNVMSIAEYHSATQMGIFPFYHWTCVLWIICMNYLYLNYLYLNYQLTYARIMLLCLV